MRPFVVPGTIARMENAFIAERLEAFAILLELAGANPYSVRAYRRAAELIRGTEAPVAQLVDDGRVRELRGIGAAIELRLRELVETGRIAELDELERTVSPEVVGFGRYLGLTAPRALQIAQALELSSAEDFRTAIEDGRVREVTGVGVKTAERLQAALARPAEPPSRTSLRLDRARALLDRVADSVDGIPAGDPRRFVDAPERLAVVVAASDPEPAIGRFAEAPDVVAILEREERRALGVTTDGIPVELHAPDPAGAGTALVRATGSPAYVAALGPLPDAPTEEEVYAGLGLPFMAPELREGERRDASVLLELADIRGDLHCHTTWSDGRASVLELGEAARDGGYEYVAVCDHSPSVGVVPGLTADDLRRQAAEIAAANERLAPFRMLRGIECDILPDGSLDLPDDVLAELDWVTASVHAGQRTPRRELTKRVTEAMRHPSVRALSHPTGRLIGRRPPNALDIEETIAVALETGVALEVNGLPTRLDLSAEHVREALDAGAKIVVNTDAHSTRGLANIELGVGTARRGGATAADVVNTRPVEKL